MKKIYNGLLLVALVLGVSSCKKYLDINQNPNTATTSSPGLVLPQAIVATAAVSQAYNSAYYYPGGFAANIFGAGATELDLLMHILQRILTTCLIAYMITELITSM